MFPLILVQFQVSSLPLQGCLKAWMTPLMISSFDMLQHILLNSLRFIDVLLFKHTFVLGMAPCDASPNITLLLQHLSAAFPEVNFGDITTFQPTSWLPHIQVLVGVAPDLGSFNPSF